MCADSGLFRDVGKCAVAIIEEELAGDFLVELRMAILGFVLVLALQSGSLLPSQER
jgi:hypothetical protein